MSESRQSQATDDLVRLFDELDEMYFESRLPRWSITRSPRLPPETWGRIETHLRRIRIQPGLSQERERGALLHEMIHLWVRLCVGPVKGSLGHNTPFKRKLYELRDAGEDSVNEQCDDWDRRRGQILAERGKALVIRPWDEVLQEVLDENLPAMAAQEHRPIFFDEVLGFVSVRVGMTPAELRKMNKDIEIRRAWEEARRSFDAQGRVKMGKEDGSASSGS